MDFFQSIPMGHFAMYFQATSGFPGPQSCSFAKARMQKVLAEFLVLDQDRGSVRFSPENIFWARAEARLQGRSQIRPGQDVFPNWEHLCLHGHGEKPRIFPNVGALGDPNLETI